MELELVRECELTWAKHDVEGVCEHRALIRITRDNDTVRWLVDPEVDTREHRWEVDAWLQKRHQEGLVETNATAFYTALAVLAL